VIHAFVQYPITVEPVYPAPEVTSVDRWHQPLSLPTFKRSALASQQDNFAWATYTPPAPMVVVSASWFQNLSQPYPAKRGLAASDQLAWAAPVSEQLETVTEDRWHQPLSLPVRQKPGLGANAQPAFAAPVWPNPETVSIDRWLQPLSKHPGNRPSLGPNLHPAAAEMLGALTNVSITLSAVSWGWTTHPLNVNRQTAFSVSAVTWNWTPHALNLGTPYLSAISPALWRWKTKIFAGFGPNAGSVGSDIVEPDVKGVVRSVVRSNVR
jgi:hypothetical protein